MIDLFKNFINKNNLTQPSDKILLAVSGGIDSVVMLDLFDKIGIKYAIAHCNFKLRLFESDDDEMFVRQLAHNYDAEVFVGICMAAENSIKKGISIQESARELRYAWFTKVCSYNNFNKIAVAHNQDDVTETFFINLFRGAGIKGLKSIPVMRQNIIRPLMFATRKQIVEYSKENNLKYREDSSNKKDNYLRNKIRHHLIPKIEEISPGFSKAAQKSIDNLRDTNSILQSAIKEKLDQLSLDHTKKINKVLIKELQELSPFNEWVYYLLNEFGFSRQLTEDICLSLTSEKKTGSKFLSTDHELLIDRDHILIKKNNKPLPLLKYFIAVNQKIVSEPTAIIIKHITNSSSLIYDKSNKIAYFDFDKLNFPLTIRRWKKGDRIIPFGMKGSKLVSDILINNKVDSFNKENTFVIISGKKIIWLVGFRSSNDFRVTKSTEKILQMEI